MSKKYHIRLNGTPAICRAIKRICPYGSIELHYENLEEALEIADTLNERISKMQGFGFVKYEGHIATNKETELAITQLRNFQHNILKFEKIRESIRNEITKAMKEVNLKNLIGDDFEVVFKKGFLRKRVDWESLAKDGKFDEYSKESNVKDTLDIKSKNFTEKYNRLIDKIKENHDSLLNFKIGINENGYIEIDKSYQEKINQVRLFEEKLQRSREIEREIKNRIMEGMKENNVEEVEVGGFVLKLNPEHIEKIPDVDKMRRDDIYEKYLTSDSVRESVTIKFKKFL